MEKVAPWVDEIQMLDGFVLRTGRVTRKGNVVKQQGVDVKLAIDAIQHAYKGNMNSCVIYSGDGDFIPLVDALVEAGVFVTVASFGNPAKGNVAPKLKAKADKYQHLSGHEFFNRTTSEWFKGGVNLQLGRITSIVSDYDKCTKSINLDGSSFSVSIYNGVRFFSQRKIQLMILAAQCYLVPRERPNYGFN